MIRFVLATTAALLALPSVASAAPCPKIVADVDKPEALVDHHQGAPEGGALEGGKVRFPGHFYDATEKVVVTYKGNSWAISKGATFKFSCYGSSAQDKNLKPALQLLSGKVVVDSAAKAPAGVITAEALIDPRQDKTMRFTVSRKLTQKSALDLDDKMHFFADDTSQPKGTTDAKAKKPGPIIGVTPYVGARPGSCRYVHGARLTLKGWDSRGFSKGTSSFTK